MRDRRRGVHLAMMFAEALGVDAFAERVKIYATDADDEALDEGARARATPSKKCRACRRRCSRSISTPATARYAFRKELRRQIIFGRHDLIQDAPISRVDLLVCRNTLMYFNAETQAKILQRFQFALNDHGVLFLGRAETLMTHTSTFAPIDLSDGSRTRFPRRSASARSAALAGAARQADGGLLIRRAGCAKSRWTDHDRAAPRGHAPARSSLANERARERCSVCRATTSRGRCRI